MLRLRPVTGKNVWEVLQSRAAEDQKGSAETGEKDGDELIAAREL